MNILLKELKDKITIVENKKFNKGYGHGLLKY